MNKQNYEEWLPENGWGDDQDKHLLHEAVNMVHTLCIYNRKQILSKEYCSCFSCISRFNPSEIVEWTDENRTAICPKCQVDSLLPGWVGTNFLQLMYSVWFEPKYIL